MKEWYMMKNPTTTSGGFEDESLNAFNNDLIEELLDTELAVDVILYNYDLSVSKPIKAIMRGNTADTYLKTMERTMVTKIGTLHSGDYIYYEDSYWLVIGRPDNNKVYEKAVIYLCQLPLKWQDDNGKVIERWANFTSASKYDTGEYGNNNITVVSNNLQVLLPGDEDALSIDGKRVFIDKASVPKHVYKITRTDDMLFNHHNQGSCLSLIASRDLFNEKTDNQEERICDYIPPVLPPDPLPDGDVDVELHISHKGTNGIVAGGNAKTFTCYALTSDGQEAILAAIQWTVTCTPENEQYVHYEVQQDRTKIKLRADYSEDIIGTQVLLTARVFQDTVSIYVEIGGGI